ncbi:MAG: AAA family ATPase [Promethearchaeota archaeon]
MSSNENSLRMKVWEILNTIQANRLYVHSATMEIPINLNNFSDQNISLIWDNENYLENLNKVLEGKLSGMSETDESLSDESDGGKSGKNKGAGSKDSKKSGKKKKKTTRRKSTRKKLKRIQLPEILTTTVLNALVPNSAMLLIGGHGGGKSSLVKYLGRMFTGMSLLDTEDTIIRGHPQLTEEKMIATLNIAKLMKYGEEVVIWRTFTTSFWKILDEVNRLSPYAQNILLSLLAEGKVKYYDYVYPTDKYVLYATLNPHDVGTFEMAPPFLDRFGISVYISMPTTHDLSIILGSQDDKLLGYDEFMQVPAILTKEELLSIWFLVDKIKPTKDAENFIHSIVREFTLCERIDKGNTYYLTPETGLCDGCHFNLEKLICNKVVSILSVRVAKDLLRYSKALAWLLGFNDVTIDIVSAIAPYVISHRVKYVERNVNEPPYWGNNFLYTKHLIEMAKKRFVNRKKCYEIIDKFKDGKGTDDDIVYLKGFESSDLIVRMDLIPLAESLNMEEYKKTIELIEKYNNPKHLDKLTKMNDFLMQNLTFPNRAELIKKIELYLESLTFWARNFFFKDWDIIRHTISGQYAEFSKALEESTKKQKTVFLRRKGINLEINVTGTKPHSLVQISCHGGKEAIELKKLLESKYPPQDYNFHEIKSEEKDKDKEKSESITGKTAKMYDVSTGLKKDALQISKAGQGSAAIDVHENTESNDTEFDDIDKELDDIGKDLLDFGDIMDGDENE